MLIIFRLATRSFVSILPVENEEIDIVQNTSFCISIDAEIDADLKNVYSYHLILKNLRFRNKRLPIFHVFWHGAKTRQFFACD